MGDEAMKNAIPVFACFFGCLGGWYEKLGLPPPSIALLTPKSEAKVDPLGRGTTG